MRKRGITPHIAREIRAEKGLVETKLMKLRMKKGLSQTQLAKKAGVSLRTVQSYEQQEQPIENAKLRTLLALCVVLDCKVEDILEQPEIIKLYKKIK